MLEGLRILEIEGLGPAPFAAMLLADLGAEVIVVHRKNGTPAPGMPDRSLIDRGKQSIELDLKRSRCGPAQKMVARSEALIEGFRPGVMERLGLGPDDLKSVNMDLVYGRMTGWGQTGPRAQTAGHDLNYISVSGAAWYSIQSRRTPICAAHAGWRYRRRRALSGGGRALQACWPRAPAAAVAWSMRQLSTGLPT
jgi:alpha-methylacyl-CoA racemase